MTILPADHSFQFDPDAAHNQATLQELVTAIAFSQGADALTLLLVRCNYGQLREQMVGKLLSRLEAESLQGAVHCLQLDPEERNLYAQVQEIVKQPRGLPGAVLVFGFESVRDLPALWVELNKRREDFRRDFPFPLVLWFTDDGYRQLSQFANDAESIAASATLEFKWSGEALADLLYRGTEAIFTALLQVDSPLSLNQRLQPVETTGLHQGEMALALAELQQQGAPLAAELQAQVAFVEGLNVPSAAAITRFQFCADHWQGEDRPKTRLKRGLALFYLGRAHYLMATENHGNHPNWAAAIAPLTECLTCFEQAQRLDLVGHGIIHLARALHRQQDWPTLEQVANRALALHQTQNNAARIAQDYGFLAAVALSRQDWAQGQALAQQALDQVASVAAPGFWPILYHQFLAQAVMGQGHWSAATAQLEQARALGVMERPDLHSQGLEWLHQCLQAQGRYWEAFLVKQDRLGMEKQYGLRAFIGAGRLRSQRIGQRASVQAAQVSQEAIAPEIEASERAKDLHVLLERIAGRTSKLIVLHGPSGVGKSSLITGGLIPALTRRALENRDNVPIVLRQYTDWAKDLTAHLTAAAGTRPGSPAPTEPTPTAILQTLARWEEQILRPVLIFDQFEEFFFANNAPLQRREFFEFLVACLELQPSALKIILSLREDYLHYLLEAKLAVRRLGLSDGSMARSQLEDILGQQILYEVGNFSPADATQIMQRLTAGAQIYLEPALIEAVVADLAGPLGQVRPIELQLVGAQLQTEGIQTLAAYQALGKAPKETLVQRYLADVVADCGPHQQALAEWVLFLLTDERGTRPLKTRPELLQDLATLKIDLPEVTDAVSEGAPSHPLDLVLRIFCDSGIVVYLVDAPDDRYQLVHDYLAAVIRDQQAPRMEALMQELDTERQKRHQAEAGLTQLQDEQTTLIKSNRRAQRGLVATVGIALVVGASTIGLALRANEWANEKVKIADGRAAAADERVAAANERVAAAETLAVSMENQAQERERKAEAREVEADAEVADALEQLGVIQRQTQQEVASARAELASARTEAEQAAVDQQRAESERLQAEKDAGEARSATALAVRQQRLSQAGTRLERSGVAASRQFEFQQSDGLLSALLAVRHLSTLNQEYGITTLSEYSAFSPLLALQTALSKIQETRLDHQNVVESVIFSPDGQRVVTLGKDGTVRLWNAQGEELPGFENHQGGVRAQEVSFSFDGQRVVTLGKDGTVRLWSSQGNELPGFENHQGGVRAQKVSFSPDGQRVVTLGKDGTVRLWNAQGEELPGPENHQGGVRAWDVIFSPDSQRLATAEAGGIVRLWNLQGQELNTLDDKDHQALSKSIIFSSDSNHLAILGFDGIARLWNLENSRQHRLSYEREIREVIFSPDSPHLATLDYDGRVHLWDTQGMQLCELEGQQVGIKEVIFSLDGQRLATLDTDGTARLWSPQCTDLRRLEGHRGGIREITFSPDSQRLATRGYDNTVRLWSRQGDSLAVIESQRSVSEFVWSILSFSFSPDGQRIATYGYDDGTVRLWSSLGEAQVVLEGYRDQRFWVVFSPDGKRLATTADEDGMVRLLSPQGLELSRLPPQDGAIAATFSPDGKFIVIRSRDETAWLWNLSSEESTHLGRSVVEFSPDSERLVTVGIDNIVRLWNLQGEKLMMHPSHQGRVSSVRFSPNREFFITHSLSHHGGDGTALLWNYEGDNLKIVAELEGHQAKILDVAFSPDGQLIVTRGDDGTVRLWNLKGKEQSRIESHPGMVWRTAFSPDSQLIVTLSDDSTVRLWNRQGEEQSRLEGRQNGVLDVIFSPDGQLIVTRGDDGTVRLWNLQGEERSRLEGHRGVVVLVQFSPNGQLIITSGADGTVRMWTLDGQQIAQYEGRLSSIDPNWQWIAIVEPTPWGLGERVRILPMDTDIHSLMARACDRLRPWLTHSPRVNNSDRALCNIPPRDQ